MCRCQSEGVRVISPSRFSFTSWSVIPSPVPFLAGALMIGLFSGCVTSERGKPTFAFRSNRLAKGVAATQQFNEEELGLSANARTRRDQSSITDEIRLVGAQDEKPYDDSNDSEGTVPAPTPVGKDSSRATSDSSPNVVTLASISLTDLENLALAKNPTLAQAQAAVTGQQGIYQQAGLYPNPQFGYLNSSASNPSVKQSNGGFYSQEFVTANKLGLAQLAASEELKRYQWDNEAQRMRVMNDLKIRYYEVLGAQEGVAVYRQLIKVSEKSLAVAESLLASEGTRTDYLQAKVQLETVRLNLEEAELRYVAAWEQLATMIGEPSLQPVPLVGNLSDDVPKLDQETCWQELLSSSPQLRAAECELGHGWATLREARALAIPNITLQAVADYDRATSASTLSTLVALPVPIFNRNQGNIDKAAADIRADQADLCRIQLVLRDQLADSFRRYQTSLRQAQRLKESILPSAEENLSLCQQLFSKGQTAFAPVLAAQQSYFKSKVAYVEAQTELHKVVTEIQGLQLTGGLNPAAIGSAIQIQTGGGAQRQRALLNELQDNNSKQLLPAAQIGR